MPMPIPSAFPLRNHSATLAPAASPLSTWMLNRRLCATASRVRLGVAMLKVMRGAGRSVREVKEDMVMPLGTMVVVVVLVAVSVDEGGEEGEGDDEVHTTTECGSRRITVRSCSDRESVSKVASCATTAAMPSSP
ncbi:hypothetical protein VMCG_02737 [Cytospora schulzeri]|uniref:Uncharacterized protein n=1 Tax=Cytospora schulzeri TaxID=448051 RepID=A0A423WZD1_9PEZI|nr:hypothetical protein VMCG_02737 [Valsa malicola]